mmetsp:Transcript_1248/g.3046  ORF Transcript_1248/g.3046 Transcript_1248/m.3046 type:complete len:201 (-) Transcript_1248:1324-1926(-)
MHCSLATRHFRTLQLSRTKMPDLKCVSIVTLRLSRIFRIKSMKWKSKSPMPPTDSKRLARLRQMPRQLQSAPTKQGSTLSKRWRSPNARPMLSVKNLRASYAYAILPYNSATQHFETPKTLLSINMLYQRLLWTETMGKPTLSNRCSRQSARNLASFGSALTNLRSRLQRWRMKSRVWRPLRMMLLLAVYTWFAHIRPNS